MNSRSTIEQRIVNNKRHHTRRPSQGGISPSSTPIHQGRFAVHFHRDLSHILLWTKCDGCENSYRVDTPCQLRPRCGRVGARAVTRRPFLVLGSPYTPQPLRCAMQPMLRWLLSPSAFNRDAGARVQWRSGSRRLDGEAGIHEALPGKLHVSSKGVDRGQDRSSEALLTAEA